MENTQFKVVHISTETTGGAGTAAARIHEALLSANIHSSFLYLKHDSKLLESSFQVDRFNLSILKRLIEKGRRFFGRTFIFRKMNARNYLKFQLEEVCYTASDRVSLPFSDFKLSNHPLVRTADIIHLHWVSDFLDYPSFFDVNTKPIVWTFHDMNPILGIFHYKHDEIRNASNTFNINKRVLELKSKLLKRKKSKLAIVCPSEWLLNESKESSPFKNVPAFKIPYPIDTGVFNSQQNPNLRKLLGIPVQNTIFLFVAQSVTNYRKGFDLLAEALTHVSNYDLTILVIGDSGDLNIEGIDIKEIGTINDNRSLRDYYSLADAFIIPSREDNLPNVMLEALASGTPVLSFNIGGMSEYVEDGFNGLKADKLDVDSMANILQRFLETKSSYNPEAIRRFAIENFSNSKVASQYLEVYKSILK